MFFNIAYSKSYTVTPHPHRIDSILLPLLIFIKHKFFNISTVANVDCVVFWHYFFRFAVIVNKRKSKIKCWNIVFCVVKMVDVKIMFAL